MKSSLSSPANLAGISVSPRKQPGTLLLSASPYGYVPIERKR